VRLDPARLEALRRLCLLDTASERVYDDITRLLATSLAVPITLVNLLDAERDFFKSCAGIQQMQSPAETSFCEAFFHTGADLIVVEDTLDDPRFASHPMVVGPPHIRFYAAARLVVRGHTVGTLCAYDVQPRQLTPEQLHHLQLQAGAVVELFSRRSDAA